MSSSKDLLEEYFNINTSEKRRWELAKEINETCVGDDKMLLEIGEAIKVETEVEELRGRIEILKEPQQKKWFFLKVAASIVFILTISFFVFKQMEDPNTDQLFLSYYQPYDGMVVFRGGDTQLTAGMSAYNSGNYREALSRFREIEKSDATGKISLLMGSCYLSLGEINNSLEWLDKAPESERQLLTDNRNWYKALAKLKTNDLEESRALLESLIKSGSAFSQEASDLLKESVFD
ncbi:MAG: tetratricopeptide repeat protein [Cyclobacteriaceae bacterium]